MIVSGIDVGSLTSKAVILRNGEILASGLVLSETEAKEQFKGAVQAALSETEITFDDIEYIVSTGTGKNSVPFADKGRSLPSCLARGASWLFPNAKAVIDIGAESATIVKVGRKGRAVDFVLNDVCAAGTGIFLDAMAKAMRVPIEEMGQLSYQAEEAADITSMCAIFAESEIVSLVHKGIPKNSIISGIHKSIAERIYGMSKKIGASGDVVLSGGVAKHAGLVEILEKKVGSRLFISDEPRYIPALGAALMAGENL